MSNNIKVALVCTSVNQLGGKNIHLKNIYLHLPKDEFQVFLICCSSVDKELRSFFLREGVKDEDIILVSQAKKWLLVPLILELRRLFLSHNIDIVHTFQMQSDIFGGLASRLSGITSMISEYESKIIEDNIHIAKQLFYRITNGIIKTWFKRTVVVSHGLKEELLQENFRAENRIEVIHLGFNAPELYKKYEPSFEKLSAQKPMIGTIGRLSKEKGIERFIAAIPLILREVADAQFVIFGQGDEENALKANAAALNLNGKLHFEKIPWTESVYKALEKIDIFVMPSLREGCPIALLEALSLARPVVASNIPGIRDIIKDGTHGFLVDTAHPDLFAEKIVFACKHPKIAISLGAQGRARVLTDFTIEKEMQKMIRLYLDVLRKK